jgi:1-acyl-sn-glycerol-3-phosphate acyltransferase
MQNIIIDKPYRFIPPHPGRFWVNVFRFYLRYYLRHTWGITASEIRGAEHLKQSLADGHGIVVAANHPRPCDPMVLGLLGVHLGQPFFTMASWHLFMGSRFQGWLIRRLGAFSVYREGTDREALKTAIQILVTAQRPLMILPEGIVTRTNDRLGTLQEGVSFIARTAARQRAKRTPPDQVVIQPVAIKYFFEGNLQASVEPVLQELETRLGWRPQRQLALFSRIAKLGDALLSLKEIEYLGKPQEGPIPDRIAGLIERVLGPLEDEWLGGQREPSVVERIKRVRSAIVPDLATGQIDEAERARRWMHLQDTYLAQQLISYPPCYIDEKASPERLLETVERFEEDLTDVARIHRPLRVVIQVGQAIPVSPTREKGSGDDPLLKQLAERLGGMIRELDVSARKQP